MRAALQLVFLFTNIGAAIALLLSALCRFVDPNDWLLPAFLGLLFLPLLALNAVCLVSWLFIKPKFGLISLVAMVLTWGSITRHFAIWPVTQNAAKNDVSIMSFNVRLFDLYNWGGNRNTRDQIFEYLHEQQTDIICFQEFFHTNDPDYFNTLDTMATFLRASNIHDHYTSILHHGKSKFGIATFSRFPITSRGVVPLDNPNNNVAIFTDLNVGSDTVRVFNIHLASVHISGLEKELSEHIENNDQDGQVRDLQKMVRQLAGGFKRRANQSQVIKAAINASPYPVIVCGDFNDTPGSYAYQHLREGLDDAFLAYGFGTGSTYRGLFPGLRIDYILSDPELELTSFLTEGVKLSDHRPIRATLNKKP